MLINCILVGIGGGLGAALRALLSDIIKKHWKSRFPLATFLINLSGSFVLGFLLNHNAEDFYILLIGTGLLGGFTTFSTFNYETVTLLREDGKPTAILYYLFSVILGLAAAWAGFVL